MMASWLAAVNEWGVPDWQCAEGYGRTVDWSLDRWRWEFTRRREDYRSDFLAALGGNVGPLDLSSADNRPEDINYEESFLFRGIRAWPFFHKNAQKYELDAFFDPVISDWMGGGPEWGSGILYGGEHGKRYLSDVLDFHSEESPEIISISFDLSRPLEDQLAEAKKLLEECYVTHWYDDENDRIKDVKKTKHHRDNWLLYLRLLDARAAGASLSKMAVILPTTMSRRDARSAGNVLNQAEQQAFRF